MITDLINSPNVFFLRGCYIISYWRMPVQLPEDLYKWLVAMKCMANDGKSAGIGKVQLSANAGVQLQNGSLVGKLIKTIIRNQKESSPSSLDHLKDSPTPSAKASNWNTIWNCFPLLRMDFDPQIKDLIIAGDNDMVIEVAKQLWQKYPVDTSKVDVPGAKARDRDDKNKMTTANSKFKPAIVPPQPKSQSVDITKLDQKKDPETADSSLQFLLLLLCQSLNLPANEVLGLFTNQNKYLAHVIAKGVKGDFRPIIKFYESLRAHIPKIKSLFESDPKSEGFTLYALKPGLVSKSPEVVLLTIDLFQQFDMYEWFVGQGKCLWTFILGVKRHPQLRSAFTQLLISVAQANFQQFITKVYKTQFQNVEQLMSVTGQLLKPLSDSKIRDQLDKSGVVFDWISTAMQNIEGQQKDNLATRLACIQFINKLWVAMPQYIQDDEETYNRLLLSMKKDWTNKPFSEFISVMVEMFNLLVALANQKNPAAKLIYNLVAIVLAQTINSQQHRLFLIQNLSHICKQFPNIPLGYLLQNYASLPNLQVFDLQFLSNTASSQNLDAKSATNIGQIASKFFQQNVINSACSSLILKVVTRFPKDLVDFVGKTVKSLLSILYATQKNKKANIAKPLPMYNGRKGVQSSKNTSNAELEMEIIAAQQRAIIIQLIKKLIMQNNDQINQKIKPYIVATSLQIKQFNKQGYKGVNALLSLYGNQKQIQEGHLTEARQRRASESSRVINNQESALLKQSVRPKIYTKVTATEAVLKHLQTLHESVIEKHKKLQKQAEAKLLQQQKKKSSVKKQMQKIRFLKGFGGQAQLFEDGYWQKKVQKKPEGLEVVDIDLLQPRDLQFIEIILRRYHKVLRQMFLKYTTTGFTTKNATSFDQAAQRTETISNTELIKLLKDNKLFFLTELAQCQLLVRDVNVKVLKKRQTQQFDFSGFEQFIVQFALVIFSRPHTVNIKFEGKMTSEKRQLKNMMPAQILETFFKYLRTVTEQKGQSTVLFDDPDSAYFNQTEVIKQFNKKLEEDPNFILPQGYKKVTDRVMIFEPKLKPNILGKGIKKGFIDCAEIIDDIFFNALGFHTLELISTKITKCKARPNVFVNIGSKLLEKSEKIPAVSRNSDKTSLQKQTKMRQLISSAGDVKYHGEKLLQKKNLSLGMKLGLSQVPYKYKLLGEQVAYLLDDMLAAVEAGRTTIQKPKIVNQIMKNKQKMDEQEKKAQQIKKRKMAERKKQLQKLKQQLVEKKEKDQQKEAEEQNKKKKQEQKQKRRREDMEKYFSDQKAKLEAKKKEEEQQSKRKKSEQKVQKKQKIEEAKKKFEDFNQKQIDRLTADFKTKAQQEQDRKKKQDADAKFKQDKIKRLKNKIHESDEKINQAKHKMNEQLSELFNSPAVQQVFRRHEPVLRALFDFLLRSTFLSLTQRKHNNEVIFQTWSFFNLAFKLSPLVLDPKQVAMIFTSLTKMKQQTKEYYIGLDYQEFLQALLREAVKHKTFFNKISEKIKDGRLSNADVSQVLKAQDKNQFEEQKQIDLNALLKQESSNSKLIDDYGDISKANENTVRGLIYYLKIPEDKNSQEHRFREVVQQKNKRSKTKKQQLKQKLNDDYTLVRKSPNIKIKKSKANIVRQEGKEQQKQASPQTGQQPAVPS